MQTFTVPKTEPHELDSIPRPISPPSSRAQPPPPPLSSSLLLSSRLARDSLADSPFRGKPQWPLEFILFFDPSSREADRLLNLLNLTPLECPFVTTIISIATHVVLDPRSTFGMELVRAQALTPSTFLRPQSLLTLQWIEESSRLKEWQSEEGYLYPSTMLDEEEEQRETSLDLSLDSEDDDELVQEEEERVDHDPKLTTYHFNDQEILDLRRIIRKCRSLQEAWATMVKLYPNRNSRAVSRYYCCNEAVFKADVAANPQSHLLKPRRPSKWEEAELEELRGLIQSKTSLIEAFRSYQRCHPERTLLSLKAAYRRYLQPSETTTELEGRPPKMIVIPQESTTTDEEEPARSSLPLGTLPFDISSLPSTVHPISGVPPPKRKIAESSLLDSTKRPRFDSGPSSNDRPSLGASRSNSQPSLPSPLQPNLNPNLNPHPHHSTSLPPPSKPPYSTSSFFPPSFPEPASFLQLGVPPSFAASSPASMACFFCGVGSLDPSCFKRTELAERGWDDVEEVVRFGREVCTMCLHWRDGKAGHYKAGKMEEIERMVWETKRLKARGLEERRSVVRVQDGGTG